MSSGRRILVVDDDAEGLAALAELLEATGFQVERSLNAADALALALAAPPDAVLTDLRMPSRSGFDLARELKGDARTSSVPVIAVTGQFSSDADVNELGTGLFAGVLFKPVSALSLTAKLAEVLSRRGP